MPRAERNTACCDIFFKFAGMSTRERVRVMLEWFGRRQTIALPINSVVGCLIATILLMILSENNVRTLTRSEYLASSL